jgi:CHAT domain-containing protein
MESFLKPVLAFFLALLLTLWSGGYIAMSQLPPKADPLQFVHQGTTSYQNNQFDQAIEAWQKAAQLYEMQNDKLNQALALSNLSLSYQQHGRTEDWAMAEKAISQSLALLKMMSSESGVKRLQLYAQALDIQGHLKFARGLEQAALEDWEESAKIYNDIKDNIALRTNHLNQAQALQALGFFARAEKSALQALGFSSQTQDLLKDLETTLAKQPDTLLKAKALRSLSQTLESAGKLDQARRIIDQAEQVAKKITSIPEKQEASMILLSSANLQRDFAERQRELESASEYQESTQCKVYRQPTTPPSEIPSQKPDLTSYELPIERTVNKPIQQATPAYQAAETALKQYQAAIDAEISSPVVQLQAQLNQFRLYRELSQEQTALELLPKITQKLSQIDQTNYTLFSAHLNLARSLICFPISMISTETTIEQLQPALQQAKNLQNKRAESDVLGMFGQVYESKKDWNKAKDFTQKALLVARAINAPDLSYKWLWQLGRITGEQDDRKAAIDFYREAVKTLEVVRNDLAGTEKEIQFSFRDDAEPVYRELVDLLLKTPGTDEELKSVLEEAIGTIDSLQLAELQDFFRCNISLLVQKNPKNEQGYQQQTVFIYPIILPDRLEVLFKLPGQSWTHIKQDIPQNIVRATLKNFRTALIGKISVEGKFQKAYSNQIYRWLIQPLRLETRKDIQTLVFVLDGEFRNIPMAALSDDEGKYLVEKPYALVVLPGANLFDLRPSPPRKLSILAAGITQKLTVENIQFPLLPNVIDSQDPNEGELNRIRYNKLLLDENFTKENLQKAVDSGGFSVVHLATHGNFSSDPEQTYILVFQNGTRSGALLRARELDSLLRSANRTDSTSIQLLVLSACKTAAGDRRAALGMAGLAVRAGAQSTLAGLWEIQDKSTAVLMDKFYAHLRAGEGKAKALQLAQQDLLKNIDYQNPSAWAPYVLIGNWF